MVPALEQKFAQLAEFSPATSIGHVQMPDSGTLQDLQATAWLQQG